MTVTEESPSGVSRAQVGRIVAGFAVASVLLAVIAAGVGIDEVRGALATASPGWLVVACCSMCLCLCLWTRSWQVILGVTGVDESYRTLLVTYAAATFANYVTPMGQAGGEPFIAYVLSRETEASYEESLASVVTADLLNLIASVGMAILSLGVLVWRSELPTALAPVAGGLVVTAAGVLAVATVAIRFRATVERSLMKLVAPIGRLVPRLTVDGVRERLGELRAAFDRLAADPRALGRAFALSVLGWTLFVLPLFLAGRALGLTVDPVVVSFTVSASMLAGYVPSPGGLGSIEVALTALLVALVGLSSANAYAVALLYRLTTYWFAIGVGGLAALAVVRRQ